MDVCADRQRVGAGLVSVAAGGGAGDVALAGVGSDQRQGVVDMSLGDFLDRKSVV